MLILIFALHPNATCCPGDRLVAAGPLLSRRETRKHVDSGASERAEMPARIRCRASFGYVLANASRVLRTTCRTAPIGKAPVIVPGYSGEVSRIIQKLA